MKCLPSSSYSSSLAAAASKEALKSWNNFSNFFRFIFHTSNWTNNKLSYELWKNNASNSVHDWSSTDFLFGKTRARLYEIKLTSPGSTLTFFPNLLIPMVRMQWEATKFADWFLTPKFFLQGCCEKPRNLPTDSLSRKFFC